MFTTDLIQTWIGYERTEEIGPTWSSVLLDGGRQGFVHPHRYSQTRDGGERGDRPYRLADAEGVGKDAGQNGPDGEAAVPPEPVGADSASPPGRVRNVASLAVESS